MLIPNKFSGYQAGIRLYPGGGGGGSGISVPGTGDSQIGNTGGTTGITGAVIPPPSASPPPPPQRGSLTSVGGGGRTYFQQRPDVAAAFNQNSQGMSPTEFAQQHFQQFGRFEGNVSDPSQQFVQPVYQPQYQDLNTGNRMGVSQYGQQPFFGGGGFSGGFGSAMPQMQTPFNFGGQMMGGGYGQFGMNNPFSAYSNSFLNMPSDLQGATPEQKADVYRDAMSRGFNDTQMRSQATGLYGPQSNQAWGYLQGLSMGMTPALGQGTMQNKVDFYNQARNQGYSDSVIRNAANQMIGQQGQSDWSYLQNQAARMPQMQTPFQQQPAMALRPSVQPAYGPPQLPNYVRDTISDLDRYQSQPVPAYQPQVARSSGPASRIVSRSSQARGTPNVMRRAEGGIASLMDDE